MSKTIFEKIRDRERFTELKKPEWRVVIVWQYETLKENL